MKRCSFCGALNPSDALSCESCTRRFPSEYDPDDLYPGEEGIEGYDEGYPYEEEGDDPYGDDRGYPYGDDRGYPYGDDRSYPYGDDRGYPYGDDRDYPYGDDRDYPYGDDRGYPYGDDRGYPYGDDRGYSNRKNKRGNRRYIPVIIGSGVLAALILLGVFFGPTIQEKFDVPDIKQVFGDVLGKKEKESKTETSNKKTGKEKGDEEDSEEDSEEVSSDTADSDEPESPSRSPSPAQKEEDGSSKEEASDDGEKKEAAKASVTVTSAPSEQGTQANGNSAMVIDYTPDLSQVQEIEVVSAMASSIIEQEGFDNNPMTMFDGNDHTSWQEGAASYGIGEYVSFQLSSVTQVRYLSFHLGNWQSEYYYYANASPRSLTLVLGNEAFKVDFSNRWTEYWVVFDKPIRTQTIKVVIEDVYRGTTFMDTCITEIGVYGNPEGAGSSASSQGTRMSSLAGSHTPFYGIWVTAESDWDMAQEALQDMKDNGYWKAEIFYTRDWNGLNQEPWYVITTGQYESEEIAEEKLEEVSYDYPEAYVKYTGAYQGN